MTCVWWPASVGGVSPYGMVLLVMEPTGPARARATLESWPEVGNDGRLHRGSQLDIAEVDTSPPSLSSALGVLDPVRPWSGLTGTSAVAIDLKEASPEVLKLKGDPTGVLPAPLGQPPRVALDEDEWEQAFKYSWEPYAWSLWHTWRGEHDLLVRLGSATLEALGENVGSPDELKIHVWNGNDDQPFASPQSLRDDLTKSSARKMDAVFIAGSFGTVRADISLLRRRDRDRTWLRNSALLEVKSTDPSQAAIVTAVHDRIARAMERGQTRWEPREAAAEVFRPADAQDVAYGPRVAIESRSTERYLIGFFVAFLLVVVVLPVVAAFGRPAVLVSIGLGAVLGLLVGAGYFFGGIALGTTNRVIRARLLAGTLASSAVGAGVSAGVRALTGG